MGCVEDLALLEPCGTGNPRPQLCLLGALVTELTPIGGGRHLRLHLSKFGQSYEAVYFSHTAAELGVRVGDWVDAAFYPQINLFRSHKNVQLLLNGLRKHESDAADTILRGEISAADAAFTPERADLAAVWRGLTARGGSLSDALPALLETVVPRLREEKFCLCLKIFEELGLLTLSGSSALLSVRIVPDAERADLETSQILRTLHSQA